MQASPKTDDKEASSKTDDKASPDAAAGVDGGTAAVDRIDSRGVSSTWIFALRTAVLGALNTEAAVADS